MSTQNDKLTKCKCLSPVDCWQCGYTFAKRDHVISPRLVFSRNQALSYYQSLGYHGDDLAFQLQEHYQPKPCGKCMICQMRKRKDMTVRLSHEASMHDTACFITLTYDNDNVPTTNHCALDHSAKCYSRGQHAAVLPDCELEHQTLYPIDVQLFMKRLRRHLEYVPKGCIVKDGKVYDKNGDFVRDHVKGSLRYFAVGEYGSHTKRPHYHIIIFGWSPSDAEYLKTIRNNPYFISPTLSKLWQFGFHSISSVSPAVAKYCARYVTKKYSRIDKHASYIVPEFTFQSVKNGGIGATWFDVFGEYACKSGKANVQVGDHVFSYAVPRYYFDRLRKSNLPLWLDLRDQRIEFVQRSSGVSLPELIRKSEFFTYQHLCEMTLEMF